MGVLGSLIGGGLGFIVGGPAGAIAGAGIGGGYDSAVNQKDANIMNAEQAQANRDFQERMSSTAYQRGVKDMEAAGLNPMLAYSQGGASSPGGAQANLQAVPSVVNAGSALQAMQAMSTGQSILQSRAETERIVASADQIRSQTVSNDLNTAIAAAQAKKLEAEGMGSWEDILRKRYEAQSAQMAFRANMGHRELEGTGFAADVKKRKAEADLARLEASKQGILKLPYVWLGRTLGPISNGAARVRDYINSPSRGPVWEGGNPGDGVWPVGSY